MRGKKIKNRFNVKEFTKLASNVGKKINFKTMTVVINMHYTTCCGFILNKNDDPTL